MKQITMEMLKSFEVNKLGYKVCESGDYRGIKNFDMLCEFPDNCVFGDFTTFARGCMFGANSHFGSCCNFTHSYFGKKSIFGEGCKFNGWCEINDNSVVGDNCVFMSDCSVLNSEVSVFIHTFGDVYINNCTCEFGEIKSVVSLNFASGCKYTVIMLESGDGDVVYSYGGCKVAVLDDVDKFIQKLDEAGSSIEDECELESYNSMHKIFKEFVRMIKQ